MSLANIIKELRQKEGISQSELGKRINMSQQQIAQYENGNRLPKLVTMAKLSGALNVELSLLTAAYQEDFKDPCNILKAELDIAETKLLDDEIYLLNKYNKLNSLGKHEAIKRVKELTEIERYIGYLFNTENGPILTDVELQNTDSKQKEQLKRISAYSNILNTAHAIENTSKEEKKPNNDITNDK
ncbi:helix-turn-helix domain-containing protein [Anaerosporobacter sp.]|uniref:helix-turn-helix domain-containing protein n=1 Tax=Anaerosporobacter sp. TaxID=1872529 RepID=UPI00286FAE86|nr:helix-turn-helix domain-containing protein [Anaerosporobacter sp.]